MNSLLKMRLPGILAVGLVALAVGAAGASASAPSKGATASSLASQKKKALKKCNKKKTKHQRTVCKKKVNKKYKPKPKVTTVDVGDDYYAPSDVTIKPGEAIRWKWLNTNHDGHNVTYGSGPPGIDFRAFTSGAATIDYSFQKTFTKSGTYQFYCSFHSTVMKLAVNVVK